MNKMKSSTEKITGKKLTGYQSDDDTVRYKINTNFYNNVTKSPPKLTKKQEKGSSDNDDENIRYKFPTVLTRSNPIEKKPKPKSKIKVNFWSNKQTVTRLHNAEVNKKSEKSNRRHTIGVPIENSAIAKQKITEVKVRKRVSFLPTPIFSDNHVPMVTVPDDLTIQLNEEEANDLLEDLNAAFVNGDNSSNRLNDVPKRKSRSTAVQPSPINNKRKRSYDNTLPKVQANENELEFFSKYVVQKLRRMETNQRIYSENLINTVIMLGQLGKLNGKSKVTES